MSEELKIEVKADTMAIKNAEKELSYFGEMVKKKGGRLIIEKEPGGSDSKPASRDA